MNSKSELICSLNMLRVAREQLVKDFVQKNTSIFTQMYKYEKDIVVMKLAVDSYFVGWLNSHVQVWNSMDNCNNISRFVDTYNKLIFIFSSTVVSNDKYKPSFLLSDLLRQKSKILRDMLKISHVSQIKLNELLMSYERDKAIFNRQIEKILKERKN